MLRVISIDDAGVGYELTDRITGLRWSNVRNGGDESASFVFHAPWRSPNPEVAEGSTLVIYDGLDVVFQGEIAEPERIGGATEQIGVTAYGLGVRAKRTTLHEIYVTRSLAGWGEPSLQRRLNLLTGAAARFSAAMTAGMQDSGETAPGIVFTFSDFVSGKNEWAEGWFYGGGVDLGEIRYDFKNMVGSGADSDFLDRVGLITDDLDTSSVDGSDHNAADATDQSVVASSDGYKYASLLVVYLGAALGTVTHEHAFLNIRIFGRHGLAKRGESPDEGFYASDVIADIIGRLSTVVARRIDPTSYVIQELEFMRPVSSEEAIAQSNRFDVHQRVWGTWGPNSPLDRLGRGYFDYTAIEGSTQHWLALREQADELGLQTEEGKLFNVCHVNYTDEAGIQRTVTRTLTIPELGSETRETTIEGGILTTGAAEALGDAHLALYGGFAPARGQATFSEPIRHHHRGPLSPTHMRADGSNLRLPDVLPSTTLFELDSDPDRRTTFPIHRVEVDASGSQIRVTVEIDQTSEALSALGARLEAAADLIAA